jgi:hypothetical protein
MSYVMHSQISSYVVVIKTLLRCTELYKKVSHEGVLIN